MGLHDREYVREDARRPRSWLTDTDGVWLIIWANIALFLLNLAAEHRLFESMALPVEAPFHPLDWWKLVAHGFAHDSRSPGHILFNMIALWFFGRDVEGCYRRAEFLRIYFVAVVVAGLGFCGMQLLRDERNDSLVGASGAVLAVTTLYAIHFPHRTIMIYGVFPIKVYVLVGIYIALDLFALVGNSSQDLVAHSAHLAGAAFAGVYYHFQWHLGGLIPTRAPHWFKLWQRKMKGTALRAHRPADNFQELAEQADALLEKISRNGLDSLSAREKEILEEHGRRVRERRGR